MPPRGITGVGGVTAVTRQCCNVSSTFVTNLPRLMYRIVEARADYTPGRRSVVVSKIDEPGFRVYVEGYLLRTPSSFYDFSIHIPILEYFD